MLFVTTAEAVIDNDYNSIEEETSMEISHSSELSRPVRYRYVSEIDG